MTVKLRTLTAAALLGCSVALSVPALAQDAGPSIDDIIGALRPAEGTQTRGLTLGIVTGTEESAVDVDELPSMDFAITFEYDSDELTDAAKEILNRVGVALISNELLSYRYLVGGHTDAVGSDPYNDDLSLRRAASVRRYLTSTFPIEDERLETYGYGETRLADPDHPDAEVNRRVELRFMGEEG